ncbi:MAG: iron ABC transporter permease [Vicinamibacterales bacterium]
MTTASSRDALRWVAGSAALFALAAVVLPFVGPSPLDYSRVWARAAPDWSILVQLRLSRTLLGLFAGAALGLAGSVFQTMLRDTLATPYTLGVSAGASLGAVAAIALNWYAWGVWGIWIGALAGAVLVLVLVTGATSWQRDASALALLLAGIAINSVCSALILLVLGLSGVSQTFSIARWLIGSLDAIDYRPLVVFMLVVTVLAAALIRRARDWNLLSIGEAWAGTRGADVRPLLRFGYVAGSTLAALTVAVTGPIGFIGLVVPHLVRMRVSADDRVLMPCAFFLGGVFLASCDALGRVLIAPAEIPAGAITACIGGPYLVWLVRRRI